MKVSLQVLCLLVFGVVMLTACGRSNAPDAVQNYDVSIRWGHGHGWSGIPTLPQNMEVVNRVSSTFSVSIIPEVIQDGYDENNPPNIFMTVSNPHDSLQRETTRTIPMDMISRYAPNYYSLLMSVPFGLSVYTEHATGDLMGLPIYHGTDVELWNYSVYRLDWLEEHNVSLPNNIVPIKEGRIYFTPTPFTHDQFIEIMSAFSEPVLNYGFAIMRRYEQLQNLRVLKGMWGLGNSIVNDNGSPNYYFADPRYKEFLQFMAYMYGERRFTSPNQRVQPWQYETLRYGIWQRHPTGWFQANLGSLIAAEGMVPWLLELQPEARLLVMPPEIGPFGDSGAGIRSMSPFNSFETWVIGSQTTDEELAVILEIFDYVTFDINAYVMVNFGIEGEHFEWEGTPFDSRAMQIINDAMIAYNSGVHVFGTRMFLPERGVMFNGDNVLTRYSTSDAGRQAVILPYREDIYGEFTRQYAELTERYGEELMRIRERFFLLAIRGQIDIEAEWDAYIDELNESGLQQFLALVQHFPVVGR